MDYLEGNESDDSMEFFDDIENEEDQGCVCDDDGPCDGCWRD